MCCCQSGEAEITNAHQTPVPHIKNGTVLLQALQGYKYRLKLTPGSQRKGKAARQVG